MKYKWELDAWTSFNKILKSTEVLIKISKRIEFPIQKTQKCKSCD